MFIFFQLVSISGGASRTHMIGGLEPYTNYTFKLGVCNSEGCVNSSETYGTTQEDGLFTFISLFYEINPDENKTITLNNKIFSLLVYMGVRVEGISEMKIHSAVLSFF